MMHCNLSAVHCLASSLGSADTQRGAEAVSGSGCPTWLFLAAVPPPPPDLLLLHAATLATASATTAAIAKTLRGVVRIAACLLPVAPHWGCGSHAAFGSSVCHLMSVT